MGRTGTRVGMRAGTRAGSRVAGLALALVIGLLGLVPPGAQAAQAAQAAKVPPDPPAVLADRPFADPSVLSVPGGFLALSTGAYVPRATSAAANGPYAYLPPALAELPAWATRPEIWAADALEIGGQWVLYYSVPVAGLGPDDRCIGTAVSPTPAGTFVPLVTRPLVCPRTLDTPRAWDRAKPARKRPLPAGGVIDPSAFVDTDGRVYLSYRTQSFPSSIRLVELDATGTRTARGARSTELLRVNGTIENPVLVRRPSQYVLFTSEGDFRGCRYETTWRKAKTLDGFATAKRKSLLKRSTTGVCGPGGADIVTDPAGQSLVFFHGWTCPLLGGHCPADFWLDRDLVVQPRRAMYAATMRWTGGDRPVVKQFLAPPV